MYPRVERIERCKTNTPHRAVHICRAMVAILLCAGLLWCGAGCESAPVADTECGTVKGDRESGVSVFRGIPYAKPPVGALRFKPPQPPDSWTGTRNAIEFGDPCPQPEDEMETVSLLPQSEDCLTLNVWTPATDGGRRPVMMWIHGGGWMWGSGRDDWSNGSVLARRGDVVVVTINYRLGAFGYLYLGDVGGEEYAASGNLGLLDQVAALEWIRDNISRFGGDPEKVTVFGESAGSMSTATLMGTPAAKGLFSGAIAESGALNTIRTREYAAEITRRLMEKADVGDVEQLLALDTAQILDAEAELAERNFEADTLFGPVVDGVVLPEPPLHAVAAGSAAGVNLLTGTTADEIRYWSFYIPALAALPISLVRRFMPTLENALGTSEEKIIGGYKARHPEADSGELTEIVGTDIFFRIPQIRLAEAQSAANPHTWMYMWTWESPVNRDLGACHAIEIPFVFGTTEAPVADDLVGEDTPNAFERMIQDTWIAFARTGDPNHPGIQAWPEYETHRRATMKLDVRPAVQDDPDGADRRTWDGIPFDGITPAVE